MKVSYQWLNQYLPLQEKHIKPADLAEKLARTSVDINDVYSPMDGLKKLVVGESFPLNPTQIPITSMFAKLRSVMTKPCKLFVGRQMFKRVKRSLLP